MTETDRQYLDFANTWWRYAGAKDSAIRDRFGISSTRYYAALNRIIEDPQALAYAPQLVRRLQRQRDARRRQRAALRATFA